jgi:uncharacterized protein YkwD
MRSSGATDEGKVPRLRSLLGALALVACLSATSAAVTPLAQAAKPHHKTGRGRQASITRKTGHRHHRHARTATTCAKKSSFHASGHIHRGHRHTSCAKRHSGRHHVNHPRRHRPGAVGPAHAGDACPGADLLPTQNNVEAIRGATLCLVNQERADHGEAALQLNAPLQQSAQAHTESMAFGDYFEHDGPGGDTPLSRMIAAGYIPSGNVGYEIGENIGWGTLSLGTPHAIVAAWMASPGHRANILDARFRDTAIGVSPHVPSSLSGGQSGGIYTQDFGVIITG